MKKFLFLLFIIIIFSGYCQAITFAVFGDCHLQDTITTGEKILTKIIESVNQHPEIEFVVCLGDIVGYPSSVNLDKYHIAIEKYLKISEKLNVPLFTIAGNHDLEGGIKFKEVFQKIFGDLFFSVEKNGFVLIFLNSEELSEQQIEWLKTELKKQGIKLIFMHKPIIPVFFIYNHAVDIRTMMQLKFLLENNNVIAVFSGHDHIFHVNKNNKFIQVISGGSGGKLAPAPKNGKSAYHYCIISIKDGRIMAKPVIVNTD
ncbi:MAG: metallophosphoesterase [Candidatus Omnitrophica bacterium]|nr:metallophosphoesterase [Candidatus Omnitrophota bacterium]